ncbi:hypothetical protein Tco_0895158 [Tanacetum coccineum]|uniref:Uncharacterized protein n=1 Tax=Tanacetum coccineum TaxID=301880 RepID=A0ABQ5CDR6_9ASTR
MSLGNAMPLYVMAISVILVSLDSSEESVWTSTGRVILFGTIPTTIPDTTPSVISPTTHIDTTLIPTFDTFKGSSSDHIPPLPTTSPFLSSTDDSSDSDIPDTPPSPTHVDYSSSVHISLDDSSRDSSSSSSSESSSDPSTDALSDFASSRSSSDHSLPTPSWDMRPSHQLCLLVPSINRSSAAISERRSRDSSSVSPSRKRSRSPTASVPLSSPTLGALSYVCADLLPSPKKIRSPKTSMDLKGYSKDSFEPYVPRVDGLGVDFEDESYESSRHRGTDLEMDVDVVRNRGIDARVVVEAIDQEEIETSMRGLVEVRVDRVTHLVVADDIPEPDPARCHLRTPKSKETGLS